MPRFAALALALSLGPALGFGVTSVDDTTTPTTTTTTTTTNEDDGSAAGVDQCFIVGGDCASCCGACTITTDLDNLAKTGSCVCYEASSAPSSSLLGTNYNDCVFIVADDVNKGGGKGIYVRNQCLESAE